MEIISQGSREYDVPREVMVEGGAAVEAWFAGVLLAESPEKAVGRMTRAELEDEAARLGLRAADDDGAPVFIVAAAGDELVNADFVRAIEARRSELAAVAPVQNKAPAGADDGEGGDA